MHSLRARDCGNPLASVHLCSLVVLNSSLVFESFLLKITSPHLFLPLPLIHPSPLHRSSVRPPLPFPPQQEGHAFHGTCAEAQMSALAAAGK